MAFKVELNTYAERQLDNILAHILFVFCNRYAAANVYEDFSETIELLAISATGYKKYTGGALDGLYKIRFRHHNYIMLYRIYDDTVIIERIYHMLQDYES